MDIRLLSHLKFCTVGEATSEALGKMGIISDYTPAQFTTGHLLEGLLSRVLPGEKVLLARADIANPELAEGLKEKGVDIEDLIVYKTIAEPTRCEEIRKAIQEKRIDFITFTSSSTVRNFLAALGSASMEQLSGIKVVCIGPVTAETARDAGLQVSAVADVYTIDGLVDKLVEMAEIMENEK
jgi:uroporphyrinogen III methyltransferase / synthase